MKIHALTSSPDVALDPLHRYHACKAMARGYAEARKTENGRLTHARAFCALVVEAYWTTQAKRHGTAMKMRPLSLGLAKIATDVVSVAESTGQLIAEFPVEDAGYLIGSIYTVMLPDSVRSSMGAYYTPPPLVARLLDLAEDAGFDYAFGSVIDPACGGGAFLAPVALRMIAKSKQASPSWLVRSLSKRLRGIEIDPFAAWMTRVLLEAAVLPLCIKAKKRLDNVVTVADALQLKDVGTYDLVIGNPPYGRVSLDETTRDFYSRSLYGHANLYGLFTDLALRLSKPDGVIAYLTPTSFLGGQYFKALRKLLTDEASPAAFDFVTDRHGVFDDVLQETMLTTYTRKRKHKSAFVSIVIPQGLNLARVESVGTVEVVGTGDPWLLPRDPHDAAFLKTITSMPTRLSDIGYSVSTGPLVWNRHKDQLRVEKNSKTLPLIWAESVVQGKFEFSFKRRNHVPFIAIRSSQPHLIIKESCVLVQRTTSKEQDRRLVAAVLPQKFLDEQGGAVIENHLNMIQAKTSLFNSVSPRTIAALLNSKVVDRSFRCISGSVAVSAYELNALPLPTLGQLQVIEKLVHKNVSDKVIERAISAFYGVI